MGEAKCRLSKLTRRKGLTKAEAHHLARLLKKAKAEIPQRPEYELIHGDLSFDNIIFRDEKAVLIDLDKTRFGNFTQDIVRVKEDLCQSPDQQEIFLEAYFSAADSRMLEIYDAERAFFEPDYHLEMAHKTLRRIHKRGIKDPANPDQQNFRHHKNWLVKYMGQT
jgi:Ser/Thr protein kinase RdoA (MazF antagonist)